jgi:hypothetical protein
VELFDSFAGASRLHGNLSLDKRVIREISL